jgi:hypothetical protein
MTTTLSATRTTSYPIRDLILLIGPEETVKLLRPPTDEDRAQMEAFRRRVAEMSDDDIRSAWGIRDNDLIQDIRDLFDR